MEEKMITQAVRKNLLRKNRVLWFYGITAFFSFAIFLIFWCTSAFRDAILSSLELRNGTGAFAWWQSPPVSLVYKVYVFNYTNAREFENGEASKLHVEEVGPYVYRESLSRVNVRTYENGTVSYQEKRTFEWHGGRTDNEIVTVPNVPLMAVLAYSRDVSYGAKVILNLFLAALNEKTFLKLSAGELLWGYDDKIYQMARPFISQQAFVEKFGLLAFKNGLGKDRITMNAGIGDLRNLGLIERINGRNDRNIWGDDKCDGVYGTDGSMFPPHLIQDTNTTLYVYVKDICRNIPFRYEGREFANGIPALRYKVPSDAFTSTTGKDYCFCTKQSSKVGPTSSARSCPPAGIFNVSVCNVGSPLLASFPHFYSGAESLFEPIDGLSPEPERHQTYFDLHPWLAVPMTGWSRFQLNLEVRKVVGVPFSGNLKDGTILPLIWIEAGIDRMPEPVLDVLRQAYYTVNAIEAALQWCSLIAAILSVATFLAALKRNLRSDPTLTTDSAPTCAQAQTRTPKPIKQPPRPSFNAGSLQ